MDLRPAAEGDEGLLASIEQAANTDALAHVFAPPYPWAAVRDRWAERVAATSVAAFVVVVDGVGVGYLAHDRTTLLHLGVVARHRGTGLADAVLAQVPAHVDRLWVLEENVRARRFYERHGWRPDGRTGTSEYPPHPVELGYTRRPRPLVE
ncbi:ribosomal protein S18 acetylase RimI-like enzyme [Aeromicrobium sp. SORGH_AS981]|uniref:GNAT family N-acetyltransferase n=1 Tax=Aeromicrobium sp. SORGH_AS_0981 TaxID=3041802 RepID=UPI00285C2995|nr:GNAT family N-acetyltransferase [Aeromicrobium sp. SORGH_AS_0981]MDR6117918.1 ribosomal protein S18 acetylase RimI-like enzyme [Aeromicrobium sp. SORGH_AS_0981]